MSAARKPRILFVCTGNVFRSLSAEFGARAADTANAYHFASAGTATKYDRRLRADVLDATAANNLDASLHISRPLTQEIADDADLIIAMDRDHQRFIRDTFNRHAPLYLEISSGHSMGIPDLPDIVPNWRTDIDGAARFVRQTIDSIVAQAPSFLENLPRFLPAGR